MTDSVQPIQGVSMLEAFKRDPASIGAERLQYPNLEAVSAVAKTVIPDLMDEFLQTAEGSIEEEDRAREAAIGYLVLTGAQLQKVAPIDRAIVADRFTQATIELYGAPAPEAASLLTARKLNIFRGYIDNPDVNQDKLQRVIQFYQDQLGGQEYEVNEEMDESLLQALGELRNYLEVRFADVLEIFDDLEGSDEMISPEGIVIIFQAGLDKLKESDLAWDGWKAKITPEEAMNSDANAKTIGVGEKPRPAKSLKASFGHEALIHSLRAVNGSKTGSKMLETGLPGSLDSEEGFAIFTEMSLSDTKKARSSDLYLYIAFALGELHLPSLKRAELQSIYLDELTVINQSEGSPKSEAELVDEAWERMNRVFRGSFDNQSTVVNTKDISYYRGFTDKACKYVLENLAAGKTISEIFDYVTLAKFDPINPRHTSYLAEHVRAI